MTEYETHTKEQRILTLYVATDEVAKPYEDIRAKANDYLTGSDGPSGATFRKYEGLWNGKIEEGAEIEIWVDDDHEAEVVRGLRDFLQQQYDLHCVCLKDETVTMEHRQPAGDS